ncbi:hypothetical protein DL98DRAFT_590632 [Cadophora sp. DSE1049]|nr:hypothetical protein DL98DRAFT_590632 [Cadophora sp. DSE1049]
MMPIYSDLTSSLSSDRDDLGDEEKLLASFESSTGWESKSTTPSYWRNLLLGKRQNRDIPQESRAWKTRLQSCFETRSFALHLSLILSYSVVWLLVIYHSRQSKGPFPLVYTPAQEAISPEAKILSVKINQTSNIFNAEPSPKVDEAWSSLFQYANIRITKEEVQRLGRPSVALSDGSGDYFGTLDVYHQLHCLKYIRQYVHQDYYSVRDTNVPVKDHVNHCIEMLRQVVMCKADTTLMTYEWLPDFPGPWPNFGIQHECVNWEKIDNWSKERSIDIFDPKYLHHPKFGFSYAHHDGTPANRSA